MGRPLRLDGTIDIECADWATFVCGVLYKPSTGPIAFHSLDEMVDELRSRGGTWWTWGGGRYDSLAVAQVLKVAGVTVQCSTSGSSVSRMQSGSLAVLDACSLIPMPLADAAGLADLAAPRNLSAFGGGLPGWDCTCGEDCGGYCRIARRMPALRRRQLVDYCAYDARVAYTVLATVIERWTAAGLELRGTIGQTAWATAQKWAGLPSAEWDPRVFRTARKAYYGGRLIVARPRAAVGAHYDMSAAYPAALARTALPIGDPVEGAGERAAIAYNRRIPGLYLARVTVPNTYLPPLPIRDRAERTYYPTGKIKGWWTALELQAAEERGVQIYSVDECIAWPDGEEPLFGEVMARWYAERMKAGKETAWGALYRELMNSVTGKLAEAPDRSQVLINPTEIRYCDPRSKQSRAVGCTVDRCTERCGAYVQLDNHGLIYAAPFWRIGDSAHVHWAAYLTSATRIAWLRGAEAVGEDLVYGHTDSIWSRATAPPGIGKAIGDWDCKHTFGDWECRAPNVYRYVDGNTGEVVCRAGGMQHLSDVQWSRLSSREQVLYSGRGVMTLREAAGAPDRTHSPTGGSLFRRRFREGRLPQVTGWYGDRCLDSSDGRTYPRPYAESKEARSKQGA